MEIFFVRHGLTQSNIDKRLMGSRIDEPLIPTGYEQILQLIPTLPKDFSLIFASPLRRAVQSAQLIADALGIEVQIRNELIERDSGMCSGKTWPEVEALTQGQLSYQKLLANEELDYVPWGGEAVTQVWDRLEKFLNDVRTSYTNKKILVVAHGGIIRLMYRKYAQAVMPDLSNASLHSFSI